MAGMKRTVAGTTIVETLVASSIFLLVFILSADTISRIQANDAIDPYVLCESDYHTDRLLEYYRNAPYIVGKYTHEYEWGNIVCEIRPYEEYDDLYVLKLTTEVKNIKRTTVYTHLIKVKK